MAQSGRSPGFQVVVSLQDRATRGVDNLNKKIAQSTSAFTRIGQRAMAGFRAVGFDRIASSVGNIGRSVLNLRNSIAGVLGPFARIGTILGGIAVGSFVKDSIEAAGALLNLADVTGIGVESLQRLQYVAKQQNVSTEAFTGAITKMSIALGNATKPSKKLTETQLALTKGLGFSMQQVSTGTVPAEEALLRLSDAMARIEDPAKRARFASAILGKGWKDVMPVLRQGRNWIEATGNAAAVMSEGTVRSAKAFGDTMTTLGNHLRAVAYDALAILIPELNAGANSIDAWATANRAWLATTIVNVVNDLIGAAKAFGNIISTVVVPALKFLEPIWRALEFVLGENNARLLVFTAVVAPKVLSAVVGLTVAIGQFWIALARSTVLIFYQAIVGLPAALGWLSSGLVLATKAAWGFTAALLANPITWIIGLIVALGAAAYLIWRQWEPISEFFGKLWATIKRVFWDALAWVGDFVGQFIPEPIKAAWGTLIAWAGDLWSDVKTVFWTAVGWLGDFLEAFTPQPLKDLWATVAGFFTTMWAGIRTVFDDPLAWLGTFIAGWVPQPILDAWSGVTGFFQDLWTGVGGWFDWAWEKISKVVGSIGGAVEKVVGWGKAVGRVFGFGGAEVPGVTEIPPAVKPLPGTTPPIPLATPLPTGVQAIGAAAAPAAVPPAMAAAPPRAEVGPAAAQSLERASRDGLTAAAQQLEAARQAMEAARQVLEAARQMTLAKAQIVVNFANTPEGMRATLGGVTGPLDVTLNTAYAGPRGAIASAY